MCFSELLPDLPMAKLKGCTDAYLAPLLNVATLNQGVGGIWQENATQDHNERGSSSTAKPNSPAPGTTKEIIEVLDHH